MTEKNLSLKGLNFQATKIEEKNNILTITLSRPETVSYTHLTLPTNREV